MTLQNCSINSVENATTDDFCTVFNKELFAILSELSSNVPHYDI